MRQAVMALAPDSHDESSETEWLLPPQRCINGLSQKSRALWTTAAQ